jgi:hypothetical protein
MSGLTLLDASDLKSRARRQGASRPCFERRLDIWRLIMVSKRSLFALTVGVGLSLAACTGEQDTDADFDFETDTPEKAPMDGGTGYNKAVPAPDCIKGMTYAMTWYQGWNPNTAYSILPGPYYFNGYNPALDWVRCDGTIQSPGSSYPSPRIMMQPDAIRMMAWAGSRANYGITSFGSTQYGNGWFNQNWAVSPMSADKADILGGLIVAKWNLNPTTVEIYVEADGLDGSATMTGVNPADYSITESMILFDPLADNPWYPDALPSDFPELYVFAADTLKSNCYKWNDWLHRRICRDGVSCGIPYRPEDTVGTYCKQADGVQAATSIDNAHICLGGRVRPVKVRVKPAALVDNELCEFPPE